MSSVNVVVRSEEERGRLLYTFREQWETKTAVNISSPTAANTPLLPAFQNLDDHVKEEYLDLELWKKENYESWKAERDAELKLKMAQSGRYKSYRRYMKNNGPGRMYFDDS